MTWISITQYVSTSPDLSAIQYFSATQDLSAIQDCSATQDLSAIQGLSTIQGLRTIQDFSATQDLSTIQELSTIEYMIALKTLFFFLKSLMPLKLACKKKKMTNIYTEYVLKKTDCIGALNTMIDFISKETIKKFS